MVKCIIEYLKDIKCFDNFKSFDSVINPTDEIVKAAISKNCEKLTESEIERQKESGKIVIMIVNLAFIFAVITLEILLCLAKIFEFRCCCKSEYAEESGSERGSIEFKNIQKIDLLTVN